MRFTPLALSALTALTLAACSSGEPVAVRYDINYRDLPINKVDVILDSVQHVIQGRLASLNTTPADLKVVASGSGAIATLSIPADAADELTRQLTSPYTLRFLRQSGSGETVTQSVAKYGNFSDSGLTEEHVLWVEAGTDKDGLGTVSIALNDAGHTLLKTLSASDAGRQYGLFAKGRLISLFTMQASFGGDISLEKIPSPDLAAIFADDVNVGLHVNFVRASTSSTN
jgi:hypothetical protein